MKVEELPPLAPKPAFEPIKTALPTLGEFNLPLYTELLLTFTSTKDNPLTLNVPPVLFVNVAVPVPLLYVPPVTYVSGPVEPLPPSLKPLTLNVPPVLFVNVAVPFEYVPPVM